jgi:hypothetical protein
VAQEELAAALERDGHATAAAIAFKLLGTLRATVEVPEKHRSIEQEIARRGVAGGATRIEP